MVDPRKLEVDGIYLVHEKGRVINGVLYTTTSENVNLAERVLREEFSLVDEIGFKGRVCPKIGLVCERERDQERVCIMSI